MAVNIYFLIVGILVIISSFTHALNGHNTILNLINSSNIDISSKTIIFYVWHIITIENLVFGIAFLVMAFNKKQARFISTAWLIAIIIFTRWCVIFGSTLLKNSNAIASTLMDSIAIFVLVVLIIIGTKRKDKVQF